MLEYKELLSPVWTHLSELVIERASGSYLYTSNGTRILDFTSGFGVTNTGHCHPRVVAAIQEQAARLLHGQLNLVYHPGILRLAYELSQILPFQLNQYFFANSGAEAVEGAVKLARQATKKTNLIVFQNGFHGRTGLTMALSTSKARYREKYQPLVSGVFIAPYPYSYYFGWEEEETVHWCLKQLDHMLATQTAPSETAAIIIEPILGEGGVAPAPPSFLQGLRNRCDELGILLIFDEVQSGWGRSGKLFAYEYSNIGPDILVMGKGLASGMPMGAIAANKEVMEKWLPGSHGGTFNGNAVACAAAMATIEVMKDEGLCEQAFRRGQQFMERLFEIQRGVDRIGEVRGRGLMIGVEFSKPGGDPESEWFLNFQRECLRRGLLIAAAGPYGNVCRLMPPLVISDEEVELGLDIMFEAMNAITK